MKKLKVGPANDFKKLIRQSRAFLPNAVHIITAKYSTAIRWNYKSVLTSTCLLLFAVPVCSTTGRTSKYDQNCLILHALQVQTPVTVHMPFAPNLAILPKG